MKYITLSAATILSLGLHSAAGARESYYNLNTAEPSISVNLGALGALQPSAPLHNGTAVSGYVDVPGSTPQPGILKPNRYAAPAPRPRTTQVAKAKAAPKASESAKNDSPMPTETAKPVVADKPEVVVENRTAPTPKAVAMPMPETAKIVEAKPTATASAIPLAPAATKPALIPPAPTAAAVMPPANPPAPPAVAAAGGLPPIASATDKNLPAPVKPAITLPSMAASDIKAKPLPVAAANPPALPPAPSMAAHTEPKGPTIVVADSKNAGAKTEADKNAQNLPSDLMTAPAIVPEAAKKPPTPGTKETAQLQKSDKVVSLPAVTATDLTALPPQTPAAPLPKLIEAKSSAPANMPSTNTAAKPAPSANAKTSGENIATPNFLMGDDEVNGSAPTPAHAKQTAKPSPASAKKPDAGNAAIAAKNIDMPAKPIASNNELADNDDSSLMSTPKEVKLATPAKTAATASTAPVPLTPSVPPLANSKPATLPPATLPPIASANDLEKPKVKDLPPLSSLYNDKTPASAPPIPAPAANTNASAAALAAPPAAVAMAANTSAAPTAAPQVGMPSKDTVMVQPPAGNQASDADMPSDVALSMVYGEAEVELPLTDKPKLDNVISQLNANKDTRLAVIAYASGTKDQASQAKRTALARALAVRSYLLEHNISADRMDIKPLGNKTGTGVPDRVDIVLEKTSKG